MFRQGEIIKIYRLSIIHAWADYLLMNFSGNLLLSGIKNTSIGDRPPFRGSLPLRKDHAYRARCLNQIVSIADDEPPEPVLQQSDKLSKPFLACIHDLAALHPPHLDHLIDHGPRVVCNYIELVLSFWYFDQTLILVIPNEDWLPPENFPFRFYGLGARNWHGSEGAHETPQFFLLVQGHWEGHLWLLSVIIMINGLESGLHGDLWKLLL